MKILPNKCKPVSKSTRLHHVHPLHHVHLVLAPGILNRLLFVMKNTALGTINIQRSRQMICTQVTIINSIVTLDWTLWSGGKKVNKSADVPTYFSAATKIIFIIIAILCWWYLFMCWFKALWWHHYLQRKVMISNENGVVRASTQAN